MRRILFSMIGLSVLLFADFSRDDTTQIVTDSTTELQWQDDANVTKTWREAIDYCELLTLGGYDDWRLPNFNELYYLADRSKANPAIDSKFHNVVSDGYWSSTSVVGHEDSAWLVGFYFGGDGLVVKSHSYDVRCVRSRE